MLTRVADVVRSGAPEGQRKKSLNRRSNSERAVLTRELDDLCRQITRRLNHGKCALCEATEGIETAHLLSKGSHPELRHHLLNLLPMCHTCHAHLDYRGNEDQHAAAWATLKRKYRDRYVWVGLVRNRRVEPHSMPVLREYRDQLKRILQDLEKSPCNLRGEA